MIDYEEIERYVNDQMNEVEKSAFKNKLKADDKLQEEVKVYSDVVLNLKRKYENIDEVNKLKLTLANKGNEYFKEDGGGKIIHLKKYLMAAAAIAAIFVVGFFIFGPKESLYDQYAQFNPVNVQVKGDLDQDLVDGVRKYNAKEFLESDKFLRSYLKNYPEDVQIHFVMGSSYMQQEKHDNALIIFGSDIIQNSIFKYKADWYIALIYLKQGNTEECKKILNLINQNSSYYSDAQSLMREL
ncbi:MAG: tetratricopeptide (TPR) repeat protein [Patiriisocius sp.]|jgi:tetratricopeptide (TPR) repeat protein